MTTSGTHIKMHSTGTSTSTSELDHDSTLDDFSDTSLLRGSST